MINLESNQVYGGSPYTNPKDHPVERLQMCNYCNIRESTDEDELCDDCREYLLVERGE